MISPANARTDSDREMVLTRRVKASVATVWDMWTDPDHISRWWGPEGMPIVDCCVDLRQGGVFRVVLEAPGGSRHPASGIIREMSPPNLLVIDGDPQAEDPCGAGLPPGATVTFRFEPIGDLTQITIHTRFPSRKALEAANAHGYGGAWEESAARVVQYTKNRS